MADGKQVKPRLYSDYNGPYQPDFMLLNYQGTKADLERLGLALKEGMNITVYSDSDEDEDLVADGVVRYGVIPGTDGKACWYADTRGSEIRYVKRPK